MVQEFAFVKDGGVLRSDGTTGRSPSDEHAEPGGGWTGWRREDRGTLRKKLISAFLSLLCLFAVVAVVIWRGTDHLGSTFREVHQDNLPATRAILEARFQLALLVAEVEEYLLTGDDIEVVEFRAASQDLAAALRTYEDVIERAPLPRYRAMDDQARKSLQAVRASSQQLVAAAGLLFALPAPAAGSAGNNWREIWSIYRDAMTALEAATVREERGLLGHAQRVEATIARLRVVTLAAFAIAFLVAYALSHLLAYVFSEHIRRPVAEVTAAVRSIARGDWSHAVEGAGHDEIGELATAVNQMRTALLDGEIVRRERDYLDTVMNAIADPVIVLDPHGAIASANPAAPRLLGSPLAALEGVPFHSLVAGCSATDLQQLLHGPGVQDLHANYRAADGAMIPVSISSAPFHDAAGEPTGVATVARDMRPMLELIADLEQARDAALAGTRAKSDFLAAMSHEIRTPLNGVYGMTELAMEATDDSERRHFLGRARSCAEALMTVVGDVLDFSRIESGRLDLESVEFDPRAALNAVLDTVGFAAAQKGIELIGYVEPSVPEAVRGDPGRLRQILLNFAANAVKFTERGEVVIRIARADGGGDAAPPSVVLRCTARDTGIGIPSEKQATIFEPFVQADSSVTRRHGGSGLGLAIVRRLVERMGGTVGVESEPGRGSTFTATVRFEPATPAARKPAAADLTGLRVLVIDDNATSRTVLAEMLRGWGCAPTAAGSVASCIDRLDQAARTGAAFDAVLVDTQALQAEGAVGVQRLLTAAVARNAATIALTRLGPAGNGTVPVACAGHVAKPIKQEELRAALAEAAGHNRPTQPLAAASPPGGGIAG